MKTKYTFTVLRYIHDVVSGEFANVGVALYAPDVGFLGAACASTYGRLSKFFGGVEGEHIKRLLRHVEAGIDEVGEKLLDRLPFEKADSDVTSWVKRVLPIDDSSLQFSPAGGGLTNDPRATLEELYERYVERYSRRAEPPSRTDEEIWPIFKKPLAERQILPHMRPKRITAKDYEHEFPYAWKNGVWNTCEAVSFDLVEAGSVIEKANAWLGRGVNLGESDERFKVYLLLGQPREQRLLNSFIKAKNILHKMPCDHELVTEDEASEFAELVAKELKREG